MRILLDTHTFLWFHLGDSKLSTPAREAIEAPENEPFISIAGLWELAIKASLGKISLTMPFRDFVNAILTTTAAATLPVSIAHLTVLEQLPFRHRDPFDRTLIAQCLHEGLGMVSADSAFDAYGIARVW